MNKPINSTKSKNLGSARAREGMFQIICVVVLSFIALCQIFPFFLKLVDSLHSSDFIPDSDKLYLWPEKATIENYLTALQVSGFWEALGNTAFHSVMFTAISLCIAIVVGYTLAKMEFKGKKFVSAILLATMMVPGEVLMIPNYILVMNMGFSHTVEFEDREGVTIEAPNPNSIIVKGIDKQVVGQLCAEIREVRPPEPYKGKGIKYVGERIIRKEGKLGKK